MIRFYNGPVLTLQQDQMNITHQEVWVDGNRIVCAWGRTREQKRTGRST